ncbi:MAG: helix-turn-helix transcriptional regulator [Erythrobacter sp.]
MEIRQRLGSNVKRLRLAMRLSQEEFAHRASVHRTYVSDIELGKRNPTIEIVEQLATALDVKPGRLLD